MQAIKMQKVCTPSWSTHFYSCVYTTRWPAC